MLLRVKEFGAALATTGTRDGRARYTAAAARTRSTGHTLGKTPVPVTSFQFGRRDNEFEIGG